MYVNFCPIETNYSFSQINKAKFNQSPDWADLGPACILYFCWPSQRVCVTQNHEASTDLYGRVHIYADTVHMYSDRFCDFV